MEVSYILRQCNDWVVLTEALYLLHITYLDLSQMYEILSSCSTDCLLSFLELIEIEHYSYHHMPWLGTGDSYHYMPWLGTGESYHYMPWLETGKLVMCPG